MYALSWPQFGKEYFQIILENIKEIDSKVAFDVACGTGLHTKTICSAFKKVYAIEPNADMLNQCKSFLYDIRNVEFCLSTAENLSNIEEQADVIFVAQAFNLLNHDQVKSSFRKKLKKDGLVVLSWNSKIDHSLFRELSKVSEQYCPTYKNKFYKYKYEANTFNYFFKKKPKFYRFLSDIPFFIDKETFLSRCLSTSYALAKWHANFSNYLKALEEIFNKHQNAEKIFYPLETIVYIGEI